MYQYSLTWFINLYIVSIQERYILLNFYRVSSYASVVLAVIILSVCLSIRLSVRLSHTKPNNALQII